MWVCRGDFWCVLAGRLPSLLPSPLRLSLPPSRRPSLSPSLGPSLPPSPPSLLTPSAPLPAPPHLRRHVIQRAHPGDWPLTSDVD